MHAFLYRICWTDPSYPYARQTDAILATCYTILVGLTAFLATWTMVS